MKTAKQICAESNYACAIERTHHDSKWFDIALAVAIGLCFVGMFLEWWL
jgi:hypothetical protein